MCFPTTGFDIVTPFQILEEKQFEDLRKGQYYPVNIGDIFRSRYQVVGKLGFGLSSTVMARSRPGVSLFLFLGV